MGETADRKFERWRRTGEAGALADVFDEIAPQLLRLAIHLVGDVAAAEDLVQSTFVVAIESAHSWDSARPLEPWLTGILDHRARKLIRSRQRPLDDAAREDVEHETPVAHAIANEASAELAKALDQIEEPYRSVMVLSVMHGMEPAAIAHALVRSPGVVRVQLHRGREMLKKSLPAGVVASATIAIGPARGMAAIKSSVLSHAASTFGAKAAMTASGGLLAVKNILAVSIVLVLVASGALVIVRSDPRASVPPASTTSLLPVAYEEATTPAMAATQVTEPTRQRAGGEPGLFVVSGRVVNLPYAGISASSRPATQCKLDVSMEPRNDPRGVLHATTETDESGSFRIELHRPAGVPLTLLVGCPKDPLYRASSELREIDADTTSVSDVVLERAAFGRLVGVTVDDRGQPVVGVRVRLMPIVRIHPACEAISDEHGRFEMHPTLETKGDLETELDGWSLYESTLAKPQETGGFAEATLVLAPTGKLILRALDAMGDPRTQSRVRFHVQPAEVDPRFDRGMYESKRFEATTDEHGIAEFDQLWIGKRLSVRVRAEEGTWWNDVMRNGRLNMYDDPNGEPVVIGPSGVLRLDVPR